MSWDKNDLSYKTLINKRMTSSGKAYYEEVGDNTLNLNISEIWTDAIPSDPSLAVSQGVAEHVVLFALTEDTSVANKQCYYAFDTVRLKDWISDKYGDGYLVQLYQNNGVQIYPTDASAWYFNYKTGILTFNGSTSAFVKPFKISAYRYKGMSGITGMQGITGVLSNYVDRSLVSFGDNTLVPSSVFDEDNGVVVRSNTYDIANIQLLTQSVTGLSRIVMGTDFPGYTGYNDYTNIFMATAYGADQGNVFGSHMGLPLKGLATFEAINMPQGMSFSTWGPEPIRFGTANTCALVIDGEQKVIVGGIGDTGIQKFSVHTGDINLDSGYGIRVNNTAISGHFLRGDGTRYLDGTIQLSDLPPGLTGSGSLGITGYQGITGANGVTGSIGVTGASGITGSTSGATGVQGPQGPQGTKGDTGAVGFAGSGTAQYITKFTGTNTIGNSSIFTDISNTNVTFGGTSSNLQYNFYGSGIAVGLASNAADEQIIPVSGGGVILRNARITGSAYKDIYVDINGKMSLGSSSAPAEYLDITGNVIINGGNILKFNSANTYINAFAAPGASPGEIASKYSLQIGAYDRVSFYAGGCDGGGNPSSSPSLEVDGAGIIVYNEIKFGSKASSNSNKIYYSLNDIAVSAVGQIKMIGAGFTTTGIVRYSVSNNAISSTGSAIVNGDFGNLGTANTIPKFTTNGLANSVITDDGAGNVTIGNSGSFAAQYLNMDSIGYDCIIFRKGGVVKWQLITNYPSSNADELSLCSAVQPNAVMHWAQNGNVGINVVTPGVKLHILGSTGIRLTYSGTAASSSDIYPTGDAGGITFKTDSNVTGSAIAYGFTTYNAGYANRVVILSNGNVGISKLTPTSRLEVENNVLSSWTALFNNSVTSNGYNVYMGYNNGTTRYGLYIDGGANLSEASKVIYSPTALFVVQNNHFVGINNLYPATTLSALGSISFGNGMVFCTDSYTVGVNDLTIKCRPNDTATIITLPQASDFPNRILNFILESTGCNVQCQSTEQGTGVIEPGQTSRYYFIISTDWLTSTIQSDGTDWHVIERGT